MNVRARLRPYFSKTGVRTLAATTLTAALLALTEPATAAADAPVQATAQQTDAQESQAQKQPNKQKPIPLPVSERVTLGPAPTGADAAALVAQDGLFIDLRTDEDLKEKGYVPTLGLHRQRLPIAELSDADSSSTTLRDMLERAGDRPVWIGCNSGNRAALAWAMVQIQAGMAPEDALAAVDPLATYEPLRDAILKR